MKLAILSAHAHGHIDPTLMGSLLSQLPNRVESHENADAVLVPISYHGEYVFNTNLRAVKKPVVLIDMLEYFSSAPKDTTHLLGQSPLPRNMAPLPQWHILDEWVRDHPPALYFKRELLSKDRTDKVIPIEWPCTLPASPLESREQFDRRPFDVFYNWGYSNPLRPKLAGEMYELMAQGKIEVIASFDHMDAKAQQPGASKWVSVHTPHTHRLPMAEVIRRQGQCKLSVSLPGSGRCCFRSTEITNAVPVMLDDGHAWSHPWVDGENCILIAPPNYMADQIESDLRLRDLYPFYEAALATVEKYRPHNYLPNYFLPAIQRIL